MPCKAKVTVCITLSELVLARSATALARTSTDVRSLNRAT